MLSLINQVITGALMSASTLINPTVPNALSFDASAYVTVNNQIRIAVQKTSDVAVVLLLRNKNNEVLYQKSIKKDEAKYAVKLDVTELTDGQYELEVKSSEGSIRKQLNLSTAPAQRMTRVIAMK
jgi:ribosomal protein L31E